MEKQEIFRVLGIDATKDEGEIKRAYREKLVMTNPEDNPEGFKRLRQAYEEACAYARTGEESEGNKQGGEDTTPSGRWAARALRLYESLSGRQDVDRWRELFEDDEFLSLEGEEECRRKFFHFMLGHFRFPTEVWKVFDEKLNLSGGEGKLREALPGDFVSYIVNRVQHGEDVDFTQFEGPDNGNVDDYLRCVENCWRAIQEKKFDYAWQLMEESEQMGLYHPIASVNRMYLLKQRDDGEAAGCAAALLEKYPGDEMILYHAAVIFWQTDRKDRAAGIFEKLKADNDSHYMANRYLSEWYYEKGEYRKAKKCAEIVIGLGYDAQFRDILAQINAQLEKELEEKIRKEEDPGDLLELCWCLLQDGKFYQGLKCALSIEGRVPEERRTEYLGYLAKVYRECALYEECVEKAHAWREQLLERVKTEEGGAREKDLDRIRQSYLLCISAYHNLAYQDKGYFQKALDEIGQMEEKERSQINVLMEQARIYMEMGEHEKCLDVVNLLTEEKGIQVARTASLESYRRQWNAGGVVREARILIEQFPQYTRAYELAAKVYSDLGERELLGKLLQTAKENGIKSVFLEAYDYLAYHEVPKNYPLREKLDEFEKKYRRPVQNTGNMERFEEGEQVITGLFYMFPGNFILNTRGLYYLYACQFDKAQADFEKILEDSPGDAFAWNNLGCVFKYQGMYEKAMPCFRRAILYMDAEPVSSHPGNLADVYDKIGDYRAAVETYEKLEAQFGRHDDIGEDIIRCYGILGETDKALEAIETYFGKKVLVACREKCELYLMQGKWKEAGEILDLWKGLLKEKVTERKEFRLTGTVQGKAVIQKKRNLTNIPVKRSWSDYHTYEGWYLLLGKRKVRKALASMERAVREYDENASNSKKGLCEDIVLLYFLLGNDQKCRHYAQIVRQEQKNSRAHPGFSQKGDLYARALAAFFLEGMQEAEMLLEEEQKCRICRLCPMPICPELIFLRWMIARRKNDQAECARLLGQIREKTPFYYSARAIELLDGRRSVWKLW